MGKYVNVVLFFLLFLIIPVESMNAEPVNEPGEEQENVLIVKEKLYKLGFYNGNIDEVFTEDLQSAIKLFQEYHGLPDTRIVDETTEKKLESELQESYFYGDRDADLLEIQNRLMTLGFGEWAPTIRFGPTTKNAVLTFQEYYSDLKVTGVLDTKTQAKIILETEEQEEPEQTEEQEEPEQTEEQEELEQTGEQEELEQTEEQEESEQTVEKKELVITAESAEPEKLRKTEEIVILAETEEILQGGMRSNAVKELQEELIRLGFGNWKPTTYFGSTTEGATREFQKYHGLRDTGIVDEATEKKLDSELQESYFYGDRDAEILEIQTRLIGLGFGEWTPTTRFGPTTEKAVLAFQEYYSDLKVTGVLDSKTQTKLRLEAEEALQRGMRSNAVKELQQELIRLGFGNWKSTTYFGFTTEDAVKDFQKYYGLNVNGIYDSQTEEKLEEVGKLPLSPGLKRPDVKRHQETLIRLGFGNWKPTTYFGSTTEGATREFQKYHGLRDTGIVDEATEKKLDSELQESYFYGDRDAEILEIQTRLIGLGFGEWTPTTRFGPTTEKAVLAFQEYYSDLKVTGILDSKTQAKLRLEAEEALQRGMYSDGVKELQQDLIRIGFGNWNPTTFFGPTTEGAVKDFQRYYGINVNGIYDGRTQEKLEEVLNSPYQYGNASNDIRILQEQLIKLGFGSWNPTTLFGSETEAGVKDFQRYYGLKVNGIYDSRTQEKLEEVLDSPYQYGNTSNNIRVIQEQLIKLGFGNWNPTTFFGSQTEGAVKSFQEYYSLPISGIADEITLSKIAEALEGISYSNYNLSLEQALNIQMAITNPPPQTDLYRNSPAYIHSNYVTLSQSGAIYPGANVKVRTAPNLKAESHKYTLTPGTKVSILDTVKGDAFEGSTDWYKLEYKNEVLYAHAHLVIENATIATITDRVNVRAEANSNNGTHIYGQLAKGTEVNVISKIGNWYEISFEYWRNATRGDTEAYLNPEFNDEFQHLDLTSHAGASAAELNTFLIGKGTLEGMGQAFIEASNTHNVNELYLVSHALLETGHGTSKLATGIDVNGKVVYNMFGIEAYDSCPDECGSHKAYAENWDTPYKAIVGGAKFIGERYIHNGNQQNTIYKMRWDPRAMDVTGVFGKQYATDIGWAMKQTANLKNMYGTLNNPVLKFNVVQYKR